jgi:hypothetical protein
MAYQYDVFFSYKRDPESDDWHERVKAKLEFWLKQELKKQDVRIFFDKEDIKTGDQWRERLSDALKQSRCIVCVWSPLYFTSKWCISEWMTFVEREKLSKRELVVAASFHDGENFPADARKVQFLDFSPFANTMPAFWKTELAVDFLPLLKKFAHDLAEKIRKAPPFNETFPVELVSDEKVKRELTIERVAHD